MIHKPKEGLHPDGWCAYNLIKDYSHQLSPVHLRADEKIIDRDCFIPEPWRMRGYILSPNITKQRLLFRGEAVNLDENGKIPPALNKLQKLSGNNRLDKIYWKLRKFDLDRLLMSNPLFRCLNLGIELPYKKQRYFRCSSLMLLYSYGVPLPYVSMTSNLETALFYAVTDYDEVTNSFVPSKKKYGILSFYRLERPFSPMSRVLPVGLQVFERPGKNKEFLCRLRSSEDYNQLNEVEGFLFEQSNEVSERMLNSFDNGRMLFPLKDILMEQIKKSERQVSPASIEWYKTRMRSSIDGLEEVDRKYEITDDVQRLLRFDMEELSAYYGDIDEWWDNFCSQIYFEADANLERSFFKNLPYDEYYGRYFDKLRV